MKISVKRPLKRRNTPYVDAYKEKAGDNEELLLKKMEKLVLNAQDKQAATTIKRFAAGFTSNKVKKPKTFAL